MEVRQAALFSFASQFALSFISLMAIVTYSRLLTPEELGVFAIASSIAHVAAEFRSLGTGNYLVRSKTVSNFEKSSVLGLSIIMSYSLGLGIFFSADFLSEFFELPQLSWMLTVLSCTFFIAPFSIVPHSMLVRKMAFKVLFFVNVVSAAIAFLLTVICIQQGLSYMSLVVGSVSNLALQISIMFVLQRKEFIFSPSLSHFKEVFSFGVYNAMSMLCNRFSFISADFVIGKLGNVRDVAIFSRGLGFLDFVSNIAIVGLKPVALPYLSREYHKQSNLSAPYTKSMGLVCSIILPALFVSGVCAKPIILFMFGEQWEQVAEFVPFIAAWFAFRAIHVFSMELFLATGHEKIQFYRSFSVLVLTVGTMIVAYPYGLKAMSASLVIVGVIEFIAVSYLVRRLYGIRFVEIIKCLIPITLLSCIVGGAAYAVNLLTINFELNLLSQFILLGLICGLVWLVSMKLLSIPLYQEFENLIKSKLKKNNESSKL